ncbi:MAG: aspartate/glutamate racemase family protein [Alphaproteobacteria bacterium]
MKSVALVHSVKILANSFDQQLKEYLDEEVKIHNLWDDFLANNPNEIGEFTIGNQNRLFYDIKSAELTGADLIVVTCSTLTPIVNLIRPFVRVPLISIDDEMTRRAVNQGENLLILATAASTKDPLTKRLNAEAAKIGKKVSIDFLSNADAFQAMKALEMQKHDEFLRDTAKNITNYDCIILAQASMAHLDKDIEKISNITTLSSIALCLEQIKKNLEKI